MDVRLTPEFDLDAELAAIQAESMGWQRLDNGAFLHCGAPDCAVIEVVGVAHAGMAQNHVLWLVGEP